jgi:ubiquinone/menaquinone biosynthesis C-methylase UbiE
MEAGTGNTPLDPPSRGDEERTGNTPVDRGSRADEERTGTPPVDRGSRADEERTGNTPVDRGSRGDEERTGNTPVDRGSRADEERTGNTPLDPPSRGDEERDNLNEVRGYFDRFAPEWDTMMPAEGIQRGRALVADLPIRTGERVLDIGAGTGVLFPVLAHKVGETGRVVAVDAAHDMLRVAGRNVRGRDWPVAVVECDAERPAFTEGAFDWVVCYNAFPHFNNPAAAMAGFARVLVAGGRIAVVHNRGRDALNAFHAELSEPVCRHRLPDAATMGACAEGAGLRVERHEDAPDHYVFLAAKHPPQR